MISNSLPNGYEPLPDKIFPIPNFNSSVYSTHFFVDSWIRSSELDNFNFNKKLEELYQKDLERDSGAKKMKYLLVFDVFKKKSYLLDIKLFEDFSLEVKKVLFKQYDFYIPRSIWFLAFAMLNESNIPILQDYTDRLYN